MANSGTLKIKLVKANDLVAADRNLLKKPSSDPYVKFKLDYHTQEKKSTTKMEELNPIWNETFYFEIFNKETDFVLIKVKDWDRATQSDDIGSAILPLSELPDNISANVSLKLEDVAHGTLDLQVTFLPRVADSEDLPGDQKEVEAPPPTEETAVEMPLIKKTPTRTVEILAESLTKLKIGMNEEQEALERERVAAESKEKFLFAQNLIRETVLVMSLIEQTKAAQEQAAAASAAAPVTKDSLISIVQKKSTNAQAHLDLALLLQKGETVTINGSPKSAKDLLVCAVTHDPSLALAWFKLANQLSPGETVELKQGSFTQLSLFVEALSLDYQLIGVRNNIAVVMPKGGSVTLKDGRVLTNRQLLIEEIDLNPTHPHAFNNLAATMKLGESITLFDGRSLGRRELLKESIHLDSAYRLAYKNLASILREGETVTLQDGRKLTKAEMLAFASSTA